MSSFSLGVDELSIIYRNMSLNQIAKIRSTSRDFNEIAHNCVEIPDSRDIIYNFYSVVRDSRLSLVDDTISNNSEKLKKLSKKMGSFKLYAIPGTDYNLLEKSEGCSYRNYEKEGNSEKLIYQVRTLETGLGISLVVSETELDERSKKFLPDRLMGESKKNNKLCLVSAGYSLYLKTDYDFKENEIFANITKHTECEQVSTIFVYNENIMFFGKVNEYNEDTKVVIKEFKDIKQIDIYEVFQVEWDNYSDEYVQNFIINYIKKDGTVICHINLEFKDVKFYNNRYLKINNHIMDFQTKTFKLLDKSDSDFTFNEDRLKDMKESENLIDLNLCEDVEIKDGNCPSKHREINDSDDSEDEDDSDDSDDSNDENKNDGDDENENENEDRDHDSDDSDARRLRRAKMFEQLSQYKTLNCK
jgi:hypothetical protein